MHFDEKMMQPDDKKNIQSHFLPRNNRTSYAGLNYIETTGGLVTLITHITGMMMRKMMMI